MILRENNFQKKFFDRVCFENKNSKKTNEFARMSNKKALIKIEKQFRQSL
jgi:hypothetical protein